MVKHRSMRTRSMSKASSTDILDDETISMTLQLPLLSPPPLGDKLTSSSVSSSNFNFENTVCSHGFFMMAPNKWNPATKTLQRPFRLSNSTTSVTVSVSHTPASPHISLKVHGTNSLSNQDQESLLTQVARMLRISEDDERKINEFHKIHPDAKKRGFGRVFRSPTLFEDTVKSRLLCNIGWPRTLEMCRALCELQLQLKNGEVPARYFSSSSTHQHPNQKCNPRSLKRKIKSTMAAYVEASDDNDKYCVRAYGDFPSPKELMNLDEKFLKEHCKVGYRAKSIFELAKIFDDDTMLRASDEKKYAKLRAVLLDDKLSSLSLAAYDEVFKELHYIPGFGPFACSYVLMCMGFYEKIPADSETARHLREIHGSNSTKKTVLKDAEDIYSRYAPFQYLAYWSEIWHSYEIQHGRLSELSPENYKNVAGNFLPKMEYR